MIDTELLDCLFAAHDQCDRFYGVTVGVVTNIQDPERLGRVKLKFPWLSAQNESQWARVLAPMAGNGRGFALMPEVDDEVLVAFEQGNIAFPYVLGALWNGKDKPPAEAVQQGKVKLRTLKTRAGHMIEFQEDEGADTGHILITTGGGHTISISDSKKQIQIASEKHTITLDDQSQALTIESSSELKLTGGGCTLKFAQSGIELSHAGGKLAISSSGAELTSSANLKMQAGGNLDAQAGGVLTILGATVKIN